MSKQRTAQITPLLKTIKVPLPPEDAFHLFTGGIHRWWPLVSHSVGGEDAEICIFEGHVGGRIYERISDGREAEWGRVLAWQPYDKVQFSWYPGREPETAQYITVRFVEIEGGTLVELEQTRWETLDEKAADARQGYDFGWDFVLAHYIVEAGQR